MNSQKGNVTKPRVTSWEQQAVDEIIAKEERMDEIVRQLSYYEHLIFEASAFGEYPHWIEDKMDDLQSEYADLQNEVGHE